MKSNNTQPKEVVPFVDSFVVDLSKAALSIMDLLILESREQEAQRREARRLQAVQLLTDAVATRRRVTREEIAEHVSCAYLSIQEIADKLQVNVSLVKAGLKRWWHLF